MKRQNKTSVHPAVIQLREMLQNELGKKFVRLFHFGSRVEGIADAESDYDVLCVTTASLNPNEIDHLTDLQLEIQIDYNVLFDLHFYCEDELITGITSFSPFIQQVKEEGILV